MKILSINYSIIKNGIYKKFSSVFIYQSKLTVAFLDVLIQEGVIRSYRILSDKKIEVFLKYFKGESVISNIIPISSSSRSIFYSVEDICRWKDLYSPVHSFLIINTSKNIFSSNELKNYKVGGQVLCIIN
jgi:ribosomal protein S8